MLIEECNNIIPEKVKNTFPKVKQEIFIASKTNKKISEHTTDEEDNLFLDLLKKWKIYTGIINQPSPADYIIILEFITKNYPKLNLKDIEAAIELSTSNQLTAIKSSIDESFASFSCTYVGRVLTAYVKYKSDTVHDIRTEIEKYQLLLPAPKKSLEEYKKEFFKFIEISYNEVLEKQYEYDDYRNLLFDFLYKNRYIKLTQAKKNEAILFARTKLTTKKKVEKKQSNFSTLLDNLKLITQRIEQKDYSIQKQKSNTKSSTYTEEDIIKTAANYTIVKYLLSLKKITDLLDKITDEQIKEWYDLK